MYCTTSTCRSWRQRYNLRDFKKVLISKDKWKKLTAISEDNFVGLQHALCVTSLDIYLSASICDKIGKPIDMTKLTIHNRQYWTTDTFVKKTYMEDEEPSSRQKKIRHV